MDLGNNESAAICSCGWVGDKKATAAARIDANTHAYNMAREKNAQTALPLSKPAKSGQ